VQWLQHNQDTLGPDIFDHGFPDNVDSAYAESAHIPIARLTSRNTQKCAIQLTKLGANFNMENLVVSLAKEGVTNKQLMMGSRFNIQSPITAASHRLA
jgi:hypothetical protein